ncbi:MAG: hypothetical protein K6G72_01895, partial [Lachnospiraceae bacterium]|nr:hypothetical protein [Lachnospiraceae bacterium]
MLIIKKNRQRALKRVKKAVSFVTASAMLLSIVTTSIPPLKVMAAGLGNTWDENITVDEDETLEGNVTVTGESVRLTVNAGKTLTVRGSIHIDTGKSLVVTGGGTLIVEQPESEEGVIGAVYGHDFAICGEGNVKPTVTVSGAAGTEGVNGGAGTAGVATQFLRVE